MAALVWLWPAAGASKVFFSRAEALELAFPKADRVDSRMHLLTDAQAQQIEQLGHARLESKLVRIYSGFSGEQLLGYAVIDVHNVRTLPEAFMVVLTPEGTVRSVRVLAFHEPLDYLPNARWYEQFAGKAFGEPLRVGNDVHAVIGATLSAQATVQGVRRALAYYQVLIAGGND